MSAMGSDNGHSAPVKVETLDPEPGFGGLDLPPSPPPLPLVHESLVEPEPELEAHDVLPVETGPSGYQIGGDHPLKRSRNTHQLVRACEIEVGMDPVVSGTAGTDHHGEERTEARQIDLNLGSQVPPASDTNVQIRSSRNVTQDTPSGTGNVVTASVRRKLHHAKMTSTTKVGSSSRSQPQPMEDEAMRQPLTALLGMPMCEHKIFDINCNPEAMLDTRAHRPQIPYHPACETTLQKLGLYQIAQMPQMQVDPRLVTALVERWRPETHTFHLPFGEVTVTLQDVSCLWGLPICGLPVTGHSDLGATAWATDLLGDVPTVAWKQKKRKRGDDEGERTVHYSKYQISLKWLRENFSKMPDNPTQDQVDRYTRAFLLDLFGSALFPDTSGDSVPVMYLQFFRNLQEPLKYNWGAAVLATLYRHLSLAAQAGSKNISGPLLLLQQWSWTYFRVARPRLYRGVVPELGGDDPELRPCFAMRWVFQRTFAYTPARCSLQTYRDGFEMMEEDEVNWEPYKKHLHLLPACVERDRQYWLARMPLIHFWIVSWHYPARVMRQFGLFQTVPIRPPHHWCDLNLLDKVNHSARSASDWADHHQVHVDMWSQPPHLIEETRPFCQTSLRRYRQWFQEHGMYSVYPRGRVEAGLDRPLTPPRDRIELLGYVPSGPRLRRVGIRTIHLSEFIIKKLYKPGTKAKCKVLLKFMRSTLQDVDMEHELDRVLRDAGLPTDVDQIPVDDDVEPDPVAQFSQSMHAAQSSQATHSTPAVRHSHAPPIPSPMSYSYPSSSCMAPPMAWPFPPVSQMLQTCAPPSWHISHMAHMPQMSHMMPTYFPPMWQMPPMSQPPTFPASTGMTGAIQTLHTDPTLSASTLAEQDPTPSIRPLPSQVDNGVADPQEQHAPNG